MQNPARMDALEDQLSRSRPHHYQEMTERERLPDSHIRRPRLIELIEQPYQASVTLVVAGAGFGKSALAREWGAQTSKRVIRCRIAPGTSCLELVVQVRAALASTGDAQPTALAGLPDAGDNAPDALLADISGMTPNTCLILDDCHELVESAAFAVLDAAIERLPAQCHVVVLGRTPPPLRLARLRASGQVRDVDADDLRFTEAETIDVFRHHLSAGHERESSLRAWSTAEGWITGILLAAMSLRKAEPGSPEHAGLSHHFLDDYVDQEVLAPLPEPLRRFVLATADLPYLERGLCAEVLDDAGSDAHLAELPGRFAFVEPVPGEPERWRCNSMVRESLQRIAGRVIPGLDRTAGLRRAVACLLGRNELEVASALALSHPDAAWAGEAILPWCHHLAERSAFVELGRCLDGVPDAIVAANPDLLYWRIAARIGQGRAYGTAPLLDDFETRWPAGQSSLQVGRAALGRGMLEAIEGRGQAAARHLGDALATLPGDALVERMHASTTLARLAFRDGQDQRAAAHYADANAIAFRLPMDEQWAWRVIATDRGNGYALRGDLKSAMSKYRLMLSELPPAQAALEVFLRCRLVSLLIERNDLAAATREFNRIEHLLTEGREEWAHQAAIARMRYLLATGAREEAERWGGEYLKQVRRLPEKEQLVLMLARIWLERGEMPMVRSWLEDVADQAYPWVQVFGDINSRTLAIDLELCQENFARAAELARDMLDEAETGQRFAESIGISFRLGVALHHLGEIEEARNAVRPAIERGVRGGFVRAFDVPGFDTAWMFERVWAEQPGFLAARHALQQVIAVSPDPATTILTRRELEVLRLVAQGWSNQQIAEGMYISANTVRNHLVKICRRLNAGSRMEAVIRAREAGVLGEYDGGRANGERTTF